MSFFHYSFENGLLVGCETLWEKNDPKECMALLKQQYKIKHLLTLTTQFISYHDTEVKRHHIPIQMIPNKEQAEKAILIIENALKNNQDIAIHCTKGIDRTGCIIGCFLVKQGHDPDEIIDQLVYNVSKRLKRNNLRKILEPSYKLLFELSDITK